MVTNTLTTTKDVKNATKQKAKRNGLVERNIEARSDGYSFRVRMKINNTYINETFFSLDEARNYRDLLRVGRSTDQLQERVLRAKVEKKVANSVTIGQMLERYRFEITPKKKGYKEESYRIDKLLRQKRFASMPMAIVDADVIDRLKETLATGASSSTVRKYMMLLSHLFQTAIKRRWLRDLENPIKLIELPRASASRSRRLDAEEMAYLIEELGHARHKQVRPFFEFLIETACRRGEALRLRFYDLDLDTRTMILRNTKNGEDRVVALSSRAMKILREQRDVLESSTKIGPSQRVFTIAVHQLRSAFEAAISRAQNRYKRACLSEGKIPNAQFLQDFRLHDCRREGTSRLFEKGLDVMEVSSMTGHKTLSMLQVYTRLRAADIAQKLA